LGVGRANTGFYSCGFYSWQDTVSSKRSLVSPWRQEFYERCGK
jgi:hypothetical protein